jgi:polyisoprenoid-binding protein YceI
VTKFRSPSGVSADSRNPGFHDWVVTAISRYGSRMSLSQGERSLGPSDGEIRIKTGREGVAAKVGHDLTIRFDKWSGQLRVGPGGPADASVEVEIQLPSFVVVSGVGGAKALSDGDKADITKNGLKHIDADKYPVATFRSTAAKPSGNGGVLEGTFTLAGKSVPLALTVTDGGGGKWHATGEITQTGLGLKQFKAMMGALKLADAIVIEIDLNLA